KASQLEPYARNQGAHVSCVSSTFCMAVRGQLKTYDIFDGTSWSEELPIPVGVGYELEGVSCTSPTFCLTTGGKPGAGESLVFNGSTWSGPTKTPFSLGDDECVSESFCVARAGHGGSAVFNGEAWSERALLGGGQAGPLSCASSAFCTWLDGNGRAL